MEKVKLSSLKKDDIVYIEDTSNIVSVEEILKNLDKFRNKESYTTTEHIANLDAKEILNIAIENEGCNEMYEDWAYIIKEDIKEEDIKEIQAILDRILARNPKCNIAYTTDKLIEIDI